jgi:hypothetical protein
MRASEQLYLPILAIVAAGLFAIAISFAVAKPIARVGARWRVVSLFTEAILDARRLVVGGLLGRPLKIRFVEPNCEGLE